MHHGKEQHAGGGSLCTYVRLQLHDFIGLASHQSCRSGIVERKARDGQFQNLPEWDRAVTRAFDDDAPCTGIHDVEEYPQSEDGKEPIARMTNVCPELSKRHLKGEQHHDDRDESKSKEDVAGGTLH